MTATPPPPVITITNPADPRPLSDVIGQGPEKPPRRLSRTQVRLAWLAAVIVGTTGAGVFAVARINEAHRLDREALREVGLVVTSQGALPEEGADRLPLLLVSTGSHPLTILSASVGITGYPPLEADSNTLLPDEPSVVGFAIPGSCPDSLASPGVDLPLVLTVRTYRGDERTVRVPVGGDGGFGVAFFFQTMERCGLFPPAFSIQSRLPTSSTREGNDLLLTLPLVNRARAARTISDVTVNGGLRLRNAVPTTVLGGRETVSLQLRLAIRDCSEALAIWALVPQPGPDSSFRGVVGGGTVDVVVTGDGTTATTNILGAGDDIIGQWISDVCPSTPGNGGG